MRARSERSKRPSARCAILRVMTDDLGPDLQSWLRGAARPARVHAGAQDRDARRWRRCSAGSCCRSDCGATTTACSPRVAPNARPCSRGTARGRRPARRDPLAHRFAGDRFGLGRRSGPAAHARIRARAARDPARGRAHSVRRRSPHRARLPAAVELGPAAPVREGRLSAGARAHDRRRPAARLAEAPRLRDRRRAPLSVHVAVGIERAVVAEFLRAQRPALVAAVRGRLPDQSAQARLHADADPAALAAAAESRRRTHRADHAGSG